MTQRARVSRIKSRIAYLAMLGIAAAVIFSVACSDDADQEQEQPELSYNQQQEMAQEQAQSQAMQEDAQEEEWADEQAAVAQQSVSMQQADAEQAETEPARTNRSWARNQPNQRQQNQRATPQNNQQRSTPSSQPPETRSLPGATNFEDYATTGWRKTLDDDTSTFSLDVDRTSYFLALNWVRSGYQIDPASVRAEEWVNAFNYSYEQPNVDDSFAVTTDLVEHPLDSRLHLVRIAAQAPDVAEDVPLNVTLVLDSSGSMADGNRVEIARAAAESIRAGLDSNDRLAVVLFSHEVVGYERHRPPTHRNVREIIERLNPYSSTNVQAGLNRAVRLADEIRRERPDAYNYIILMSDGVANVDATDPFAILQTAEDRDDSNPLRLITVGVGIQNYNDVLLEQLAQHGNGWYRYLSTPSQARSVFSRENWRALSTPFADQARAQVRWDDDAVAAWRLVGYENRVTSDRSFEQDRKEFAEIPSGAATTMFYEIELTNQALQREIVDLGEVELRWLTPRDGDSNRQQIEMVTPIRRFGDDGMLDFGSLVAIAADRYSWFGQDGISGETINEASLQLNEVASWFEHLPGSVRSVQAADDFALLLSAMGAVAPEPEPEDPGYQR